MKRTITFLCDRLIDQAGMIGLAAESMPADCGISGAEATLHLRDAQNALNASMDALRTALAQRSDQKPAGEPTPAPPVQAPPTISSWDLPPDEFERWKERACIMRYDGGLPWDEAERLAMQDILRGRTP